MSIYQISKIQIRRGKANTDTGFPQLASGELGWAIDTQELYIGNGSIAEGAPNLGKTKILTSKDLSSTTGNFITLVPYTYRASSNSPIVTGPSPAFPVTRSIQDRLDDTISSADFGTYGNGVSNDTATLQRAINQLFSNNTVDKAYKDTPAGVSARVTLRLPAGIYKISDTITIPSYATIIGAGIDKTIIQFTQATTAIRFVSDVGSTAQIKSPRHITIKGLTIESPYSTTAGIDATELTDSLLEEIKIVGSWTTGVFEEHVGIYLENTVNTTFNNINISNYYSAVYGNVGVKNNVFNVGQVSVCNYGFNLGSGLTSNGPLNTQVSNYTFSNLLRHAVYIEEGTENSFNSITLINVAGLDTYPMHPQIYSKNSGNTLLNLHSTRQSIMRSPSSVLPRFIPIAVGQISYEIPGTSVDIDVTGITTAIARFPIPTDPEGVVIGYADISYIITYSYKSNHINRQGIMTVYIPVNPTNLNVSLSDDYSASGSTNTNTLLEFNVSVLNNNISLNYLNSYVGDVGVLTYKYLTLS